MIRERLPGLFTVPQAPAIAPVEPPVQVHTRHIPYVGTLWDKYESAQDLQRERWSYINTARGMGLKTASVDMVATNAETAAKQLTDAVPALNRIKKLLAMNMDPTTPPAHWFCGVVEEPRRIKDSDGRLRWPRETWPGKTTRHIDSWSPTPAISVYMGAVPTTVLHSLAAAKPLVDDIRIYSPRDEDFRQLFNPLPIDPVMIGLVTYLGDRHYFEIARWDVDQDLATLFSQP